MPIYAIAIDGPLEKPNRKVYVELLAQGHLPETFMCRDILRDEKLVVRRDHIELVWLSEAKLNV